jgi:hypothetical protein
LAAAGVVTAVAAAGLVFAAPTARADPVDYTSRCVNQVLPQLELPDLPVQMDLVVTPAKETYQVGDRVSVEWQWKKYPTAPPVIPVVGKIDKDSTYVIATLAVGGDQVATIDARSEQINPLTLPGEEFRLANPKVEFTLTKAGRITLTPAEYSTFTAVSIMPEGAETKCVPVNPVAVSRTIEVAGTSAPDATLVPDANTVSAGDRTAVSGQNWPQGTPLVELCAADGTQCKRERIGINTVAIADGRLAGNVGVNADVPEGRYSLHVKVGLTEVFAPLNVGPAVAKTIALSTSHGPLNSTVTVTGRGFPSGPWIYVQVFGKDDYDPWPTVSYVQAEPDGTFTVDVLVDYDRTTQIIAYIQDLSNSARQPFKLDIPGRDLTSEVTGAVDPGALTISQQADGVQLSSVTIDGTEQHMTGAINAVTVKDHRGGVTGWTLTGSVSDFTSETGRTIAAANLSWTPRVVVGAGSPSTAVPGAPGSVGTGATLAFAPGAATGTGGTFDTQAALDLKVPAYQAGGTYAATLTLSIS